MYNLIMFDTEDELCELTGLSPDNHYKALWDAGFDLDDWDVGFCSDKPLSHVFGTADGEEEYEDESDDDYYYDDEGNTYSIYTDTEEHLVPNDDAAWLVNRMESYCVGYYHVEYNGKHYYTVHHS